MRTGRAQRRRGGIGRPGLGGALAAWCVLLAVFATAAAEAAWNQPVGGPSPINHAADQSAVEPSLAAIGGVPYVAWREDDATNFELRVSRLNATGTAWEQIGGGDSPINHDDNRHAEMPSLAAVGGVPYVAWREFDGTNYEVRVSRLNAAGTAWEQVVGGASPINQDDDRHAFELSLAAVGGVPYVAWHEVDGTNSELRVSRLNAAGTAWEQLSPINQAADRSAAAPSLAAVGGVPYVAWKEWDGTNWELRVSRLNAAGTAWEQVGGGDSPINQDANRNAWEPSLAAIGGVPYVAWREFDGANWELRVSRLNAAGTAWEQVVGGDSPINQDDNRHAFELSLAAIGGVPYVAWTEDDGTNDELRVSRLNAAGTAWEQVVGGASPINQDDNRHAFAPSLAAIGGVPYVAWSEHDGAGPFSGDSEVRVSRLEPEFLAQSAQASDSEALLMTRVRSYGVAYPIAFQYGPGSDLGRQTAVTQTAFDEHEHTIVQSIGGLTPGSDYAWRPIGFDGTRATGLGPTQPFTTGPGPGSGPAGPAAAPPAASTPAVSRQAALGRLGLAPRCVRRSRAGRVQIRLTLRTAQRWPLQVRVERAVGSGAMSRCPGRDPERRFTGRFREVTTLNGLAARPAATAAALAGRLTLKLRLAPGLYRITVRAELDQGRLSPPARRYLRVLG